MTIHDISIISTGFVISFSGVLINFIKKEDRTGIVFEQDAKTLLVFRSIIPAALIASVLIYFSRFGQHEHSRIFFLLGYLFIAGGLIVRWIAVLSLGRAFTVKVSILKDQRLKTDGIYKKIRHPSYTGFLMYYLGLGLIMQNWICLLLLTVAPLVVVLLRIKHEELVLSEHFGDQYSVYTQKSWKLFPYLF